MISFRISTLALGFLLPVAATAASSVSPEGLRLWLSAATGVESEHGAVLRWRDQSGAGAVAQVPSGELPPLLSSDGMELAFAENRLLQIRERVLTPDCRALTFVAVARVESPSSVVIFASRDGNVPLVQLDVEENGLARFIVRDGKSRTLQSLVPAPFGRQAVYMGILETGAAGTCTARVLVGETTGDPDTGPLASPLLSQVHWIGGLRVGRHRYGLDGTISELMIYDRVLTVAEQRELREHLTRKYTIKPPEPARPDSFDVLSASHHWAAPSAELETDVCVIGAGSGGVGAALAAARRGVRVLVVERQERVGGTGVNAFVCSWEPGPGCSIAEEIYERMRRIPGAAGVATRQPKISTFPMGFHLVTEGIPYSASLRRAGHQGGKANVSYKPDVFDRVVRDLFAETGNVTLLNRSTFFRAETEGQRVDSILVSDAAGQTTRIRANVFIDCTGDVYVCRSAGCEVMLGVDSRALFGESLAPKEAALQLNAMSRCYTIRPSAAPKRAEPPNPPVKDFPHCAWITGWRDGIRTINPLPMLSGRALIDLGYDECLRRTERLAQAHWHWLQGCPEVEGYELDCIAPMLGIREGHRLVSEYVLRQADLELGLPDQTHPDIIAVADHPCDIHGAGGIRLTMKTAYGIPYRCLVPKGGWTNLLAACRGSGFSKIAASSCRLERTMIQLGHAAGAGAAMAVKGDCSVSKIDVPALVKELDARSRYPRP